MRALITGSRGQDGSYLAELLEAHGYTVFGVDRGQVNLTDGAAVAGLLQETRPREVYHLAAATFVPASWDDPVESVSSAVGTAVLLASIARVDRTIRFFQASSSQVFGEPRETPQNELTPYTPRSPYAAAKACADHLVAAYRAQYGLHASSGILFNHESPRRPTQFLPAKVAHGVAAIAAGRATELVLGDLDARRDWGWAPDYVQAMWLMLQQDEPDDYVIATGEAHTVRELVELAFAHAGLDWEKFVRVDPAFTRSEDRVLVGDASKAREKLGWSPSMSFEEMVGALVDAAS